MTCCIVNCMCELDTKSGLKLAQGLRTLIGWVLASTHLDWSVFSYPPGPSESLLIGPEGYCTWSLIGW